MIKKIAVVGSGTMGHGIAESFAMYGYDVNLYDIDAARLKAAIEEIGEELDLLCEEQFIEPHVIEAALQKIKTFTDLKESVADRDYL
ncbi:MAG: 3-hydroxyacyl-CoA dehydrogenase NAD-binding domain-containing protein [Syntrophobacteraceae bacterium]